MSSDASPNWLLPINFLILASTIPLGRRGVAIKLAKGSCRLSELRGCRVPRTEFAKLK
jgi:hypothetical protein